MPEISDNSEVVEPTCRDQLWVGDARKMDVFGEVADNSVALVVTSPPYFVGKEYEEAVGQGHIPADYVDFLDMLEEAFAQCVAKLEPGGRIAVNVANLGRRPYRSLSGDVTSILQDRLGLLLRGEVIWKKAHSAGGSCAWGSFQRPGNPVLRDVTERVVIASKGRFDRALPPAERAAQRLPSEGTSFVDEFMEATTDVWEIPAASAKRVGHPAPFPVELPQRLIDLYTYRGDLVLDPFVGAGTTAVAAVRTGRHYVGFDTDAAYIALAEQRIADERDRLERPAEKPHWQVTVAPSANSAEPEWSDDFQVRAGQQGRKAQEMAREVLKMSGFRNIREKVKFSCGVEVNFEAIDEEGNRWLFDVSGAFSVTQRPGLRRTDTLWKALGKASVLHSSGGAAPLVLLTTDQPAPNSSGYRALKAVTGPDKPVFAVIGMLDPSDTARLAELARGGPGGESVVGERRQK
ncbi:DNA-methyltransferase [Candidatus Poriferisocius sp.]|uniref:DNA-methyltransferase n=1 Tax=Candidatus Poriferisocius sp. TaxID=3101276 RepID=UPI003B52BF54